MPDTAALINETVARVRLTVPTLAIAGGVVGDALGRQLEPVADDLSLRTIEECGHIIPLDQPAALLSHIEAFLG